MSFKLFAHEDSGKTINKKRDDTRPAGLDPKKVGPSLGNVRKPNLDPSKVEKLLEAKAKLIQEKEQLQKSTKGKGFR